MTETIPEANGNRINTQGIELSGLVSIEDLVLGNALPSWFIKRRMVFGVYTETPEAIVLGAFELMSLSTVTPSGSGGEPEEVFVLSIPEQTAKDALARLDIIRKRNR